MTPYQIAVVTRAPKDVGNMAMGGMNLFVETDDEDPKWAPLRKCVPLFDVLTANERVDLLVNLREPVFYVGEILFMGPNDRDVIQGRKPDKWDVDIEFVDTLDEAIVKSIQLTQD